METGKECPPDIRDSWYIPRVGIVSGLPPVLDTAKREGVAIWGGRTLERDIGGRSKGGGFVPP